MQTTIEVYVTPAMKDDLHRLYCRRNPMPTIVWAVLGFSLILTPFLARPSDGKPVDLWMTLLVIMMGIAMLAIGMSVSSIWWRWHYWPRIQIELPEAHPVLVSFDELGFLFKAIGGRVPYIHFHAIKYDERAALFFQNKSYAFPIHRSLFQQEEDWQSFLKGVKSRKRFLQTFQAP